jgi:uncharacterized protein
VPACPVTRGREGELLGREHVVRVRVGIVRNARVGLGDGELLGGQDVVRPLVLGPARRRIGHGANATVRRVEKATRTELEAAAFQRLVEHLRERTDVQNIDLMELAGFCRNCLSRWYREAAEEHGVELSDPEAREIVYGMPYEEWKARYQTEQPG